MTTISTAPSELNLIIGKGKTFGFSGTFSEETDITGWIFRLYIRRSVMSSGQPLAAWDVESGHFTVFAEDKSFILLVPATETAALPTLTGAAQEFEIELPDGVVRPVWAGTCDIVGEVTR